MSGMNEAPEGDMDVSTDDAGFDAGEVSDDMIEAGGQSPETGEVMQQAAPQQAAPQFPINEFADAIKAAIAPLAPKPPVEKKWWDDHKTMGEKMLKNPELFHKGIHELTDHKVQTALEPINKAMGQMVQIMQFLSARSAERPEFGSAQTRAQELTTKYNVPHQVALQMALDEQGKKSAAGGFAQSGKHVRVPPGHASAPDTSQAGRSRTENNKGPGDFRSIVNELKSGARR